MFNRTTVIDSDLKLEEVAGNFAIPVCTQGRVHIASRALSKRQALEGEKSGFRSPFKKEHPGLDCKHNYSDRDFPPRHFLSICCMFGIFVVRLTKT